MQRSIPLLISDICDWDPEEIRLMSMSTLILEVPRSIRFIHMWALEYDPWLDESPSGTTTMSSPFVVPLQCSKTAKVNEQRDVSDMGNLWVVSPLYLLWVIIRWHVSNKREQTGTPMFGCIIVFHEGLQWDTFTWEPSSCPVEVVLEVPLFSSQLWTHSIYCIEPE